jgi:hypothetical protein
MAATAAVTIATTTVTIATIITNANEGKGYEPPGPRRIVARIIIIR